MAAVLVHLAEMARLVGIEIDQVRCLGVHQLEPFLDPPGP